MMVGANNPKEVQFMVYREAFDTACKLDGLIPITVGWENLQILQITYEHGEKQVH